jgi:isoquinoline 1-oxidoreductase subunit beta
MRVADDILGRPSRREVLTGALASGFVFAFHLPVYAANGPTPNEPVQPPDSTAGKFAPNAFIRIDPTGKTTFVMPQVEMGQGVYTSLAMILAEELDADFSNLALEHAPPSDKLYGNPLFGIQATGNSNSIRAFWKPMRIAAATSRAMLVQAAAQQWQVEPASCTTSNSMVSHKDSGRSLPYGTLADAAQQQTPPKDVPLKDPKDFTLIGKSLPRLDTPEKVNGKVVYGIDALLPNLKFATVKASPVFGDKVAKVDDEDAKKIPGVQKVVVLDDMVAVVADNTWAALQGIGALDIVWNEGPNASVNTDDVWKALRAVSEKNGAVAKSIGDVEKALATGERVDATYELPFLAHATMEPMNCTAHVTPDGCELWLGTQIMSRVQSEVAKALGLPVNKVIVNNHYIGGGFGRRLEPDMAISAARVAQHVDGPVKVIWSREEDVQHDVYRPVYRDVISATLADGKVAAWKYRVAGSSVMARWFPPGFQNGVDIDGVDSAIDMPYDIPNFHVEFARAEPPGVPTGFWRGVGPNNNVFAIECFMDELARKAGKDPVAFRRAMLRACRRCWTSRLKNQTGANRCRHASGAVSACNQPSKPPSQRWWRPKSTTSAAYAFTASPRWWTPGLPSTPIPSLRKCRAG